MKATRLLVDPPAEVLHEPSPEHRFWLRTLSWLLNPPDGRGGIISRAVGVIMVAPLCNFTPTSLTYQKYLDEIFHRSTATRLVHALCFPMTVMWILAALCPFFGQIPASDAVTVDNLLQWNGSAIAAIILAVWYTGWAFLERAYLWGLMMLPVIALLWLGANGWYVAIAAGDGSYRAAGIIGHPLFWMSMTCMLQAVSHGFEPAVPPRMNGTGVWIPLWAYLRRDPAYPSSSEPLGKRVLRLVAHAFLGAFDELIASPRLLPIYVLDLMWRLGYMPGKKETIGALAERCLEQGNPALDYIGTGGATFFGKARHTPS